MSDGMSSHNRQPIVVGVIYNTSRSKILLSMRPPHVHQGGLWEFPGGKPMPDENQMKTLKRELWEELGIKVLQGRHLVSYPHDYIDKKILLQAWEVSVWEGTPRGNEGQDIRWVRTGDLRSYDFPQANTRLIRTVMLSPLYFITPDLVEYDETFIEKMKVLISNGLKLFQFRSPSSSVAHHGEILEKLLPVCERYGCKLVYNGSVENALDFGAHGVHLNSARLMTTKEIRVPGHFLTAASCHNLDEISQAEKLDVDFCVLSPVHRSVSHPESRAMGWERFSLMARNLSIPVYALGGIKPHELEIARGNGAHGIAMITGLWDAADPETILNKLM